MEDETSNLKEFTVSEISGAVKRQIEDQFGYVRVRGELGRVARPASGHLYFDLKDDKAVLAAVCWKAVAARLGVEPEQGLEVICTGNLTTFPGQSRYQLVVQSMEPAGEGALMALLEARRKALAAEGLFDASAKKPLPYLPEVIGVVTSPSGAVIRDILHRLADRFPRRVLVWPVRVQGEGAAAEVSAAIAGFNALGQAGGLPRPDLLIVARGGGSVEDLWAFNEENVVRAVAASDIPVISAIGHETDTTLIDFAADQRAPTPTAAAEMAVPVRADLQAHVMTLERRLLQAVTRRITENRSRIDGLARGLPRPLDILASANQTLDLISERLTRNLERYLRDQQAILASFKTRLSPRLLDPMHWLRQSTELDRRLHRAMSVATARFRQSLDALGRQLRLLSHEEILARGFALVTTADGQLLRRPEQAQTGDRLTVHMAGENKILADVVASDAAPLPQVTPKIKARKSKSSNDDQGDLF
jgi:exodeoxyribonuclease VII large subunit